MDTIVNEKEKMVQAAKLLKQSESVFFITGAGISADSGLPTYRGIGGLYQGADTEDGVPIETALSGDMFRVNPSTTWKYLSRIEKKCAGATFNRAHALIAEAEKYFRKVWVLTQNIDGFHQKAGSANVIEIHGNAHRLRCDACGRKEEVESYEKIEIPPVCPQCRKFMRPDVVLFGEMLPPDVLDRLYNEEQEGFDIYFTIGTTSVFPYIQGPIVSAKYRHVPTVEIDPGRTEVSGVVDLKIAMRAAEALEGIFAEYAKLR